MGWITLATGCASSTRAAWTHRGSDPVARVFQPGGVSGEGAPQCGMCFLFARGEWVGAPQVDGAPNAGRSCTGTPVVWLRVALLPADAGLAGSGAGSARRMWRREHAPSRFSGRNVRRQQHGRTARRSHAHDKEAPCWLYPQPTLGSKDDGRRPRRGLHPRAGHRCFDAAACRWRRAVTLWALSAMRITVM
jgi:hypothetical protein